MIIDVKGEALIVRYNRVCFNTFNKAIRLAIIPWKKRPRNKLLKRDGSKRLTIIDRLDRWVLKF